MSPSLQKPSLFQPVVIPSRCCSSESSNRSPPPAAISQVAFLYFSSHNPPLCLWCLHEPWTVGSNANQSNLSLHPFRWLPSSPDKIHRPEEAGFGLTSGPCWPHLPSFCFYFLSFCPFVVCCSHNIPGTPHTLDLCPWCRFCLILQQLPVLTQLPSRLLSI